MYTTTHTHNLGLLSQQRGCKLSHSYMLRWIWDWVWDWVWDWIWTHSLPCSSVVGYTLGIYLAPVAIDCVNIIMEPAQSKAI